MAYCVDFLVDYWVLDHTRNCTHTVAVAVLHILSLGGSFIFFNVEAILRQNISSSSNLVSGFSII